MSEAAGWTAVISGATRALNDRPGRGLVGCLPGDDGLVLMANTESVPPGRRFGLKSDR